MSARVSAIIFAVAFTALTTLLCLAAWLELLARGVRRGTASWPVMNGITRRWARWVLAMLGPLCGVRWRECGVWPGPGPALIAAQHQSTFETLLIMAALPNPTFVLKRELAQLPLFGPLVVRAGMIVVERGAGGRAMLGMLRDAEAAWAAGRQVVIFPEGTRIRPGVRAPLRAGVTALAARADKAGIPVIPVTTDSGRFWGRAILDKRPGTIGVRVHLPLPTGLARDALLARLSKLYVP